MLIDTGADVTLLPSQYLAQLEIETESGKVYEIQGFGGQVKLVFMVEVELSFLGKKFFGQFLVIGPASYNHNFTKILQPCHTPITCSIYNVIVT